MEKMRCAVGEPDQPDYARVLANRVRLEETGFKKSRHDRSRRYETQYYPLQIWLYYAIGPNTIAKMPTIRIDPLPRIAPTVRHPVAVNIRNLPANGQIE